jgi:hypothetical protein
MCERWKWRYERAICERCLSLHDVMFILWWSRLGTPRWRVNGLKSHIPCRKTLSIQTLFSVKNAPAFSFFNLISVGSYMPFKLMFYHLGTFSTFNREMLLILRDRWKTLPSKVSNTKWHCESAFSSSLIQSF